MANNSTNNLGFEDKLWQAADKLRGHMDPSKYKHVVLGLIFLKYISDAFEQRRAELMAELDDPESFIYTENPDCRASFQRSTPVQLSIFV